ncbi:MAG TPA: glycosyltransferase family 2 protein [Fimbriimonadaceae bacterium]|jgi:glycosyltransferase involved in cell wall biosynthesis
MQLDEKIVSAVPSSAALTVEAGCMLYEKTNLASELKSGSKKLSVVIPLMNEEDSIDELYNRLKTVLAAIAPNHELIFVDDGSTDGSRRRLTSLFDFDKKVKLILFRRNLGKAAGLSAGFKRTVGDVVVMMDADLQDQPEELPNLIAKLDEGFDLVTGWKKKRHDPLGKTLPSKLFNRVVGRYFDLNIHDFNCGFKAMRGEVARELRLYGDFHRFIPVFASELGFKVAECPVEHAPRIHGQSKYGMKRLVTGFFDFASTILITRFLKKPFQFFGPLGGGMVLLGILIGCYLTVLNFMGHGDHIRPLYIVCAILFLGGLQVMFTGLVGELIVRLSQTGKSTDDAANGQLTWRSHEPSAFKTDVDSNVGAFR